MITLSTFNTYYRLSENRPQSVIFYHPFKKNTVTNLVTLCSHRIFIQIVLSRQILLHNPHPIRNKKGYFNQHAPIVSTIPHDVNSTRTIPSI